jgi:hypothetical protein
MFTVALWLPQELVRRSVMPLALRLVVTASVCRRWSSQIPSGFRPEMVEVVAEH